ncbi:MAG: 50S ribosome-binding GTPase [Planctomycetales bacterium]|nr:50S ribosome-binding GTPase [Planctomycetales bacterium]
MPANLTHQYLRAEAAYRRAETAQEQLDCLQLMLREMPKHKGTDKLQADLKSRIAKAKQECQNPRSHQFARSGLAIPRQGAGRVVLLGAPNCGKSQLLAALTRAQPEIADYPFTTQSPAPGMMMYQDCPLQLIDTPPVTQDYCDASLVELIRGADLILLVVDLSNDALVEDTQAIIHRFQNSKTRLGTETGSVSQDIGTSCTDTLLLFNKADAPEAEQRRRLFTEFLPLPFESLIVSAAENQGLDQLRAAAFERINIVRVYTKHPQEKEADLDRPFFIRAGDDLLQVARCIHGDLPGKLKSARVWSNQVQASKLVGTMETFSKVKPDYQPKDGDIVELLTV